ncbi:hypothetical protein LJ737_25455 [Hymenobacter sp. 15J16-1T3B]|uniref:hypothetical protein n=1 Tax=Hymenobacter sp. 15J16-1T3B TaxID=2886941 RepID=UPI001D114325|nr:hypothetical protein [Hymenobacter sp. 15J16-1T3B]MCC3160610.1 hypothetical protein [Hymenobacter sp. 15J16-1T3B]
MAITRKAPRYTAAEQQSDALAADLPETAAAGEAAFADEPTADSLCPCCGELLAWHEQPCPLPGAAGPAAEAGSPPGGVIMRASSATYAYDLGQPVQPPAVGRAYAVIWRGQLKERHPDTGWIHRVNVYRLNDGYWDCYREEELQVA